MAASELEESEIAEAELAGGQAVETAAEFNPDLSTETNIETNGRGANHDSETEAHSPQAAHDASGIKAE